MRKIITSLCLLFMCLTYTWASTGSDLKFIYPANWEYTSSEDVYPYTIINHGNGYDGRVILFARDTNGQVYQLFEENVFVPANSQIQLDYIFSEEIQLPIGEYTFFFKYINEEGVVLKASESANGVVRAPSGVTRIPITTGTIPGGRMSLSTNRVSTEPEISLYSSVALNRVELVNMVGQVVRAKYVNSATETTLEVAGISTGSYIVVGKADEGIVSVKLLKVK